MCFETAAADGMRRKDINYHRILLSAAKNHLYLGPVVVLDDDFSDTCVTLLVTGCYSSDRQQQCATRKR